MEWYNLGVSDRETFWAAVDFLKGRLTDGSTVEWALGLGLERRSERLAIAHLLHRDGVVALGEPWVTVWGLIEESWSAETPESAMSSDHEIGRRIAGGDRSGALVPLIAALVAPRVTVAPRGPWGAEPNDPPQVPGDVVRVSLTSARPVTPTAIGLARINEVPFLTALANGLEAEVRRGMDAGLRIGWGGTYRLVGRLGLLYRIRFDAGAADDDDSDAFHRGIAPSVKLLFAVVERIAALDASAGLPFVESWRRRATPIDVRMWAAAATDPSLVSVTDVEDFLLSIDDQVFWDVHGCPEVATLRARRFSRLSPRAQETIIRRVQGRPPTDRWEGVDDLARVEDQRLYWAVRELRRIEVAGGALPSAVSTWVEKHFARFDDLAEMGEDEGFFRGPQVGAYVVSGPPDPKYDGLEGAARLEALEFAWENTSEWGDDPAGRWLEQDGRTAVVLADFRSTGDGGASFPRVWLRFGRCHKPSGDPAQDRREARAVLALVETLPDRTVREAIEGTTDWMRTWLDTVVTIPGWTRAWLGVWPSAVESTNSHYDPEDAGNLSVLVRGSDYEDLDAYNTPVADLVGVFLQACRSAGQAANPFRSGTGLRRVRDAIESCEGQSLLIARHRLIESLLPFFLQTSKRWAIRHLVTPLRAGGPDQLALWRAASRRPLRTGTLEVVGHDVAVQARNPELGSRAQRGLVVSLLAELLNAALAGRTPAVAGADVQQVLRTVDDEVRSHAARMVVRFVAEAGRDPDVSGAEAFNCAAGPFLRQVWPQDQHLRTAGVSNALVGLPLRAGESFVQAVDSIRQLLVPFDCYSIMEYGFGRGEPGRPTLEAVDDEAKALAMLKMVDLTVPVQEGAVVPHELSDALVQIRSVKSGLAALPAFRRLEAASRR